MRPYQMTLASVVELSLKQLGGRAHLSVLYQRVEQVASEVGRPLPPTFRASVRRACRESDRIVQDVPRSGIWHLIDVEG